MAFLSCRMSLGGKLSLGYLVLASLLLVSGGGSPEWVLMVLGFPLVYLAWAVGEWTAAPGPWPPVVAVTTFTVLWVANAYLWGHLAAAAFRRTARAGWWSRESPASRKR